MIGAAVKLRRLPDLKGLVNLRPRGVREFARDSRVAHRTIEGALDAFRALADKVTKRRHVYEIQVLSVHNATRMLPHTGYWHAQ